MAAQHVSIALDGVTARKEIQAVERELKRVAGVKLAYASPVTEMAYVLCDPMTVNRNELTAAVERAGCHPGETGAW